MNCSIHYFHSIYYKVWNSCRYYIFPIYYANFGVRNRNILNMSKSIVKVPTAFIRDTNRLTVYSHRKKMCWSPSSLPAL